MSLRILPKVENIGEEARLRFLPKVGNIGDESSQQKTSICGGRAAGLLGTLDRWEH